MEDDIVIYRDHYSAEIEMVLRNTKNGKATDPANLPCSVEEFGKNWSEFSEGSIEQDH